MQQLLVWRHAKAVEWHPRVEDFSRALRNVGREHAVRVARWIGNELELPELILCSPSERTRQTLAPLLSLRPELERVTHFIPQIYHASVRTLENLLDSGFAEVNRVLMVGHNPGFESLVSDVIDRRFHDRYSRLATGTLAVIDLEPGWPDASGGGGLLHLVRGKNLSGD